MTRNHRKMPAAIPNTRDGKRTDREMKKSWELFGFLTFFIYLCKREVSHYFHKRFKFLVGAAVRPWREAQSTHELAYQVLLTLI